MLCLWVSFGDVKVKSGVETLLKKKVSHIQFFFQWDQIHLYYTNRYTYVFFLLLFFEKGIFCIAVIYYTLHSPEITKRL